MLDSNEWIFTSVIPLRSLPLGEPKEPGRYDDQEEEEDEESEQDENISPPRVLVPDIQPVKTSSPTAYWYYRQTGVSLALPSEFAGLTLDRKPMELGADHRTYYASEGRIEGAQPHPHPLSDIGVPTESRKDGREELEKDGEMTK